MIASAARAAPAPTLTITTAAPAGPPLIGFGVELDPYDTFVPTQANWDLTFQRLDSMRPGFLRVVEPAYDYFAGYDAAHNPTYNWTSHHVRQLLTILGNAKAQNITVVMGDWSNPLIDGDPRVPAEFLQQLHDVYGFTNIRYYDPVNEPNYMTGCDFTCWTGIVKALSAEFSGLGLSSWLQLVAPGNANSWDDTSTAAALDASSGLDTDNPIGGDSWVTMTLKTIPSLVGAYDSHRYSTIWGIEHGVYENQMRSRREQISNADSPSKPYFEGEVGLVARLSSPFGAASKDLPGLIDPSAHASAGSFVDSQPHIREFNYGVWMGDMMIQAIDAGVSGASAWDLDDAMHVGGQYGTRNLKQWGFWNSLGGQDGYPTSDLELRPWYYSWSLISRSFPAGSRPIAVPDSGIPGLRVAAAKVPNGRGYALTLAVVNDSDRPRSITLSAPAAGGSITFDRYDYFNQDRPADANGFPVPAAIVQGVRLNRGLRVDLPARGLVVLTSTGAVHLREGTRQLVDDLGGWSGIAVHTKGLRIDHSRAFLFNDEPARAVAGTKARQALVYRRPRISGFELKAYYQGALGLRAYQSPNGKRWKPIALASTPPAPALGGGGWYFVELFPGAALRPRTNDIEITLAGKRTELAQVTIDYR